MNDQTATPNEELVSTTEPTPTRLALWLKQPWESTEAAVENAVAIYKAAANEMDRYKEVQAQAKLLISEVMAETGQTKYATPAGTALVTAPSASVSYDSKALSALCASDEGLERLLAPHRKVTERAGTLMIR